jgi:HK97 family phage prohead protease
MELPDMKLETRFAPAALAPSGRALSGIAAPFGVETRVAGRRERIAPGAFAATLRDNSDILALVDHNPTRVLARTKSGTLKLEERAEGLAFELELPDTPTAAEVRGLAAAGSLGGVSIGFRVRPGGEAIVAGVRELRALDLVEISIVSAFPAYPGTSAALRSATPRLARLRRYLDTVRT